MRYALNGPAAAGRVRQTGIMRLGLVYLVALLFVGWLVWSSHNGDQPDLQTAVAQEAAADQRATEQFALMWELGTAEQRAYLCDQFINTDGNAAWFQAIKDNGAEYDGFNDGTRYLWDQFLRQHCL